MASLIESGWDPTAFASRLQKRYWIQNRIGGRYQLIGELLRDSLSQQQFFKLMVRLIKRGGPVRVVVLKARKAFISTSTATLFYDIVTNVEGMHAGVLAHNEQSTRTLFRMVQNLWMRTPVEFRPAHRSMEKTLIEFGARYMEEIERGELGLQSSYECSTAGGRNPFTGSSKHLLHWSEVGKTPGDDERQSDISTSILNSLSEPSVVVFESTAQGRDNLFHDVWRQAEKNVEGGRTPHPGEWVPFFLAVQDNPLNSMHVEPDYDWTRWPSEDVAKEKRLIERHGKEKMTQEFLRWRRLKIQEMRMDAEKFDEDFPTSPDVAFLGGGRPAIPRHMTDAAEFIVRPPLARYAGRLEDNDDCLSIAALTGLLQ